MITHNITLILLGSLIKYFSRFKFLVSLRTDLDSLKLVENKKYYIMSKSSSFDIILANPYVSFVNYQN